MQWRAWNICCHFNVSRATQLPLLSPPPTLVIPRSVQAHRRLCQELPLSGSAVVRQMRRRRGYALCLCSQKKERYQYGNTSMGHPARHDLREYNPLHSSSTPSSGASYHGEKWLMLSYHTTLSYLTAWLAGAKCSSGYGLSVASFYILREKRGTDGI